MVPETASVVVSLDDPYWHFPSVTRNNFGSGTLIYEATYVSDVLQREIIRDVLKAAGLTGPDQSLPAEVMVRHGRNGKGRQLHYYLNFSGSEQSISYPYRDGVDLLTNDEVGKGSRLRLKSWDLAILAER